MQHLHRPRVPQRRTLSLDKESEAQKKESEAL